MTYNKVIELRKAVNGLSFLVERIQGQKEYSQFLDIVSDLTEKVESMPDGIGKEHTLATIRHYEKRARIKAVAV